ncbi:hypothetical protein BH24ACT26_BH24ACT26_22850 [soil metagenome]
MCFPMEHSRRLATKVISGRLQLTREATHSSGGGPYDAGELVEVVGEIVPGLAQQIDRRAGWGFALACDRHLMGRSSGTNGSELASEVGHYTFVSSVSVYADAGEPGIADRSEIRGKASLATGLSAESEAGVLRTVARA